MKHIFHILLIALASLITVQLSFSQERGMKPVKIRIDNTPITLYKQSHALLIGASNYNNGLKSLPGVDEDIQAVKLTLENKGFLVKVVMDPDNIELTNAFNDFIAHYGQERESRLIFYYAGHGYTRKIFGNEIGYLLPVNCPSPVTDLTEFQKRAMPMGQIELFATQIQSKHALFLFDACFSGAMFNLSRDIPGIISYKTTLPVRQFITSGSADETVPDKSIFRQQFIAGLNGEADLNKDHFITGTELGDFLQTTVVNYSRNSLHPQFGKIRYPNLDKGDFVFVLNKDFTEDAPRTDPFIGEERILVRSGKLDLRSKISGALFVDGAFIKQVRANTAIVVNNLTEGAHTITINGDETVEETVTISPNQTTYLTMEKKRKATFSAAIEMVFVEGGSYQMGRSNSGTDEWPVHLVKLKSFYVGKYEVTQKLWREIMGGNPSFFKDCDLCPVENVSEKEIQVFLRELHSKTGKEYRLPTEAEWEYAARGGNQSLGHIYSGSNYPNKVAWYRNNAGSKTHPVGQKQSNELGIYDMSGNVWEWCSDWYDDNYYKKSPSSNPQGPSKGYGRVIRGGSWFRQVDESNLFNRDYCKPNLGGTAIGFRLAWSE